MKIYTEIVYTWDDNKQELVEESSKSYDYEGPIISCHWYHSHGGGTLNKIKDKILDTGEAAADAAAVNLSGFWERIQAGIDAAAAEAQAGIDAAAAEVQAGIDASAAADAAAKVQAGIDAAAAEVQAGIDAAANVDVGDIGDIGSDIGNIGDIDIPSLDDVGGAITGGIDATLDTVTGGITDVGDVVADTAGEITGQVMDNLETNIEGAGDTLNIDEIVGGVVDIGTSVGETVVGTVESIAGDLGEGITNQVENVEGVLADNNQPFADAETNINENIAGANEDIETGIDKNTDTLNQMENTINSNISDFNVGLGNVTSIINDVSSGINKHVLDPILNIGNENSLIRNPTGWYENAFHNWSLDSVNDLPGGSGWHDDNVEDAATALGNVLGGAQTDFFDAMGGIIGGLGLFGDYGGDDSTTAESTLLSSRRNRGPSSAYGDPFGNPSETRRLINQKRTFNTAQSLINA